MDWNEINRYWRSQTGEGMNLEDWLSKKSGTEGLLEEVKKRDQKDHRLIKGLVYFLSVATALLTILVFLNPDPEIVKSYSTRATAALEILAFTLFIPVGYRKLMEFRSNLTGMSILEFLDYGEKRFRFWRKDSWILIPYLLLLGAAMNISLLSRYWNEEFSWTGFLVITSGYLLILVISFFASWQSWRRKHWPILKRIRNLRKEMMSASGILP